MIELKGDPGRARIFNACVAMSFAMTVAHAIWQAEGRTLVITSDGEGAHAGRTRGHARGLAFDCRTEEKRAGIDGLAPGRAQPVVELLQAALGPDYQVLYETKPNHIHIEWLPLDIEANG